MVRWCEGSIKEANGDGGRKKIEKFNFFDFVYYTVDNDIDISKHSLNLDGYGADVR